MKKLMTSVVALMVFGMCTSSYGYFLIYNVSSSVKAWDNDYLHAAVTIPLKGYLVLNLNDTTNMFVDANLVLYGRNSDGEKVYVELNRGGNGYLGVTRGWSVSDEYYFVYLDSDGYFGFEGQLRGKRALKDVGLGTGSKKNVAGSLKGVICVWDGMLLDDRMNSIYGMANISMTLNNAYTKAVNDPAESWTNDEIINGKDLDEDGQVDRGLKPDLGRKGYSDATPVP